MIKATMIWLWLCATGYVVEEPHRHVGKKLYTFYMPGGKTAKHAYKVEVIRFIKRKIGNIFNEPMNQKNVKLNQY